MDIVYESERLQLKVFNQEDVESAKKIWGDPKVMEYCGGAIPQDVLAKVLASYRNCHYEKGLSVYAVVEKRSGQVVGAAGYNVVGDSLEKVELIYHFSRASWGKGYASEAAIACLEIAKRNRDIDTIYASADPKNINSTKVLQKVGFQFIEMKWFDDSSQEEPYFEYKVQ